MTVERDLPRQDSKEDSLWDATVLGPYLELYEALLEGKHDSVPLSTASLTPLQQVLLVNAMSLNAGPNWRSLKGKGARQNAILSAATLRLAGGEQLSLPWATSPRDGAWTFLGTLYLATLSPQFDDAVSVLLFLAKGTGRLSALRRQQLNGLLFHPLQNADQHGRNAIPEHTVAGVSARVIRLDAPETPSLTNYQTSLGSTFAEGEGEFLELLVHDNGPGIALHFYNAKRSVDDSDLFDLPLFHEWQKLNGAFERHATSKPVAFRRSTTQEKRMPGVGLAGMLSAAKQLRAYLELRTGRLRAYQWYREGDSIPDRNLLQPNELPNAAHRIGGTIFRFLVPLDAKRSAT